MLWFFSVIHSASRQRRSKNELWAALSFQERDGSRQALNLVNRVDAEAILWHYEWRELGDRVTYEESNSLCSTDRVVFVVCSFLNASKRRHSWVLDLRSDPEGRNSWSIVLWISKKKKIKKENNHVLDWTAALSCLLRSWRRRALALCRLLIRLRVVIPPP